MKLEKILRETSRCKTFVFVKYRKVQLFLMLLGSNKSFFSSEQTTEWISLMNISTEKIIPEKNSIALFSVVIVALEA